MRTPLNLKNRTTIYYKKIYTFFTTKKSDLIEKIKMTKYLKYLMYVLKHKWYVMIECFKEGLYWRGIIHDFDKFYPDEFIPYTNFFYNEEGKNKQVRDKTGYYKPTDTGDSKFDFAWFLHQKRNDHHWQYWIMPDDGGKMKILEMSDKARKEMICDWIGAGKAQGTKNTQTWYMKNKEKIVLGSNTRKWVEEKLFPMNYIIVDRSGIHKMENK